MIVLVHGLDDLGLELMVLPKAVLQLVRDARRVGSQRQGLCEALNEGVSQLRRESRTIEPPLLQVRCCPNKPRFAVEIYQCLSNRLDHHDRGLSGGRPYIHLTFGRSG